MNEANPVFGNLDILYFLVHTTILIVIVVIFIMLLYLINNILYIIAVWNILDKNFDNIQNPNIKNKLLFRIILFIPYLNQIVLETVFKIKNKKIKYF